MMSSGSNKIMDVSTPFEGRGKRGGSDEIRVVAKKPCLTPVKIIPAWMHEDGILLNFLSFLKVSDVVRSKRVNKKWRQLCTKVIDENYRSKMAFTTTKELILAVRRYCMYRKRTMDGFGATDGFPIGKWDVSHLNNFEGVFHAAWNFNESIDSWDMSNATSLEEMFRSASRFNQPLSTWDVGKVQNMHGMFMDAHAFNQNLSSWNTSEVKSMRKMFLRASAFNQEVESWNTCNVRNMRGMFADATSFNQSISGLKSTRFQDYTGIVFRAVSFQQELPDGWESVMAHRNPDTSRYVVR